MTKVENKNQEIATVDAIDIAETKTEQIVEQEDNKLVKGIKTAGKYILVGATCFLGGIGFDRFVLNRGDDDDNNSGDETTIE